MHYKFISNKCISTKFNSENVSKEKYFDQRNFKKRSNQTKKKSILNQKSKLIKSHDSTFSFL